MEWGPGRIVSPVDDRYLVEDLLPYLSTEANIHYRVRVEMAYLHALFERGRIPEKPPTAGQVITPRFVEEVDAEEAEVDHEIVALVNVLKRTLGEPLGPFVHAGLCSSDIVDTANSWRYREAFDAVILPDMWRVARRLIRLASAERDTLQVGRTHGQHAEPITFGLYVATILDRWGGRLQNVEAAVGRLPGKLSGSVGAYNALHLIDGDPQGLERDVLGRLGVAAVRGSGQIIPPEPMADVVHATMSAWGVMADFADDMRHLARTEIAEVSFERKPEQVSSSSMPQKVNPLDAENIKSTWKAMVPRVITQYLDQLAEHQRDLTNSASERFVPEFLMLFGYSVRRMCRLLDGLEVQRDAMAENVRRTGSALLTQALVVRTRLEGESSVTPGDAADGGLRVKDYTGVAGPLVDEICTHWTRFLSEVDS